MKKIRVKLTKHGKRKNVNRKVLTEKTDVVPLADEKLIIDLLKRHHEVRLGSMTSGIRLFPLLDNDLEKVKVIAETMGDFRNILANAAWEPADDSTVDIGEAKKRRELGKQEMRELRERRNMICVTPDTMITCPTCGSNLRIGKVLSAVK